jgi:hypothetical protein
MFPYATFVRASRIGPAGVVLDPGGIPIAWSDGSKAGLAIGATTARSGCRTATAEAAGGLGWAGLSGEACATAASVLGSTATGRVLARGMSRTGTMRARSGEPAANTPWYLI